MTPSNQGRRGKSRQNKANNRGGPQRIPQFEAGVRFKKHFRFQEIVLSATTYTITRGNMLNLLFSNNSSSTSNARVLAAVKLNRVEIWQAYNVTNTTNTTDCSIEWLSAYGPATEFSDSSVSAAIPAHVISSSPPQSLSSYWSLTGSNESEGIVRLRTSNGSNALIDIWVDCVMMDDETPVTLTSTNAGVVSQLYAGYLDGFGSTSLRPVSYTSLN